mgnify:CR=1 FL=1
MKKLEKINLGILVLTIVLNTIYIVLILLGKSNSNLLVCLSLYAIVFLPLIINNMLHFTRLFGRMYMSKFGFVKDWKFK